MATFLGMNFRVTFSVERTLTCYLEAENAEAVHAFLDAHPDWQPGDVEGLVDVVGDEIETGYTVHADDSVTNVFRITPALELVEK